MSPASRISREAVDKGVLIMDPQAGREVVAIHLFLRMGSFHEEEDQGGLSNLMQRLLLKGTRSMDAETFDERLDALGSRLLSSTGKEMGSLSLLSTRDKLKDALDLLTEVLVGPALAEEELEKEREVVRDEIKQRKDEGLANTRDLFQMAFYGYQPLLHWDQGSEK